MEVLESVYKLRSIDLLGLLFQVNNHALSWILIVCANAIILIGENVVSYTSLERHTKITEEEFEMEDLGLLRYYLDMEIIKSTNVILIS